MGTVEVSEKKKKRKRKEHKGIERKLLVGQKIEVRSTEEGFHGSWHLATIISFDDSMCLVRYEHLLIDDGSSNLTESINIPTVVDGGTSVYYRGLIRPEPPPFEIHQWFLHYGLCVDAYVNEGWWEGVIFDYEDGSDERLVFFPDLGDQLMIKIEHLRVTQDWDEVSECWKFRGDWLFLELIEEHEDEWPVSVSTRQLWFDLRDKEAFHKRIKEWTCWLRPMWEDLVLETIHDNLNLTSECVRSVIDQENAVNLAKGKSKRTRRKRRNANKCKLNQVEETQVTLGLAGPDGNISFKHETNSTKSQIKERMPYASDEIVSGGQIEECTALKLVLQDENRLVSDSNCCTVASVVNMVGQSNSDVLMEDGNRCISNILDVSYDPQEFTLRKNVIDVVGNATCSDPKLFPHIISTAIERGDLKNKKLRREDEVQGWVYPDTTNRLGSKDDSVCNETSAKPKSSSLGGSIGWIPAGEIIVPRAEYCPNALVNYLLITEEGMSCHNELKYVTRNSAALKARMHLLHIGWKIEIKKEETMVSVRYIPPEGRTMYSLHEVCKHLTETTARVQNLRSQNDRKSLVDIPVEQLESGVHQVAFSKIPEQYQGSGGGGSTLIEKSLELVLSNREAEPMGGASPSCVETLDLDFSKMKIALKHPDSDVVIEPEYCPQAVIDLYEHGSGRKILNKQSGDLKSLRTKAKKHLLAMGWKLWYVKRKELKHELRYNSPQKRCYYSLQTACKGCMEEGLPESKRIMEGTIASEESQVPLTGDDFSPIICTEVKENVLPINEQSKEGYAEPSGLSQLREFIEFGNVRVKRVRGSRKRRNDNSFLLTPRILQSQTNATLQSRRDDMIVAVSRYRALGHPLDHNAGSRKLKKQKTSGARTKQDGRLIGSYRTRVLRSSKKARQVVVPSPAHHTPRTVLSWLIDNNVVLPRSKVHCMSRKGQRLMVEGRISRDGIRCNCCQNVFSISSFEAHAGSTYRRPAASIFLEDGRSLLECQKQMVLGNKLKSFTPEPYQRIKSNQHHIKNDYICSVCHYGGTLVLCDQCPSSFHLSCLGLEDLPEGKWFCPSCRCGICGQGEFNENIDQFTEKTVLYCVQCEREYHVGCVRKRGPGKLHSCPKGNWFCSKKCETIFAGLHKLLGKAIPVRIDNLSWTIFKFSRDDYHKDAFDIETVTDHHSKLNVALGVMHECFEPIKERHTKDIVRDVLFNKRSVLKRLNFHGFYTVLLESEDELISVASVRVYGEKVAEVPLVGTRVQFRRRGMLRILMNVLEKKLTELGVERLVLPAVPQLLHAWTTSFGFSKMSRSERLEFLEYTFLDFQDTSMCQKILRMTPTAKLTVPRGNRHELRIELDQSNENIDLDKHSIISEVIHAEQIQQSEVVEQIPLEIPVDNAACIDSVPIKSVPSIVATQVSASEFNQQNNEMLIYGMCSIKSSDEVKEDKPLSNGGCMKYYRRKKSAQNGKEDKPLSNGGCMKYYRRKKSVRTEPKKEDVSFRKDFYKYFRQGRKNVRQTTDCQASY